MQNHVTTATVPTADDDALTEFGRILGETGVTDTRFARMVNDAAWAKRRVRMALARSTVGHWRHGMHPRDPMVADLAADALSDLLGYPVSPADLGWRGGEARDDLGLTLGDDPADAIGALAALAGRDARRDGRRDGPAFAPAAFADPVLFSVTGVIRLIGDAAGPPSAAGRMVRDMTNVFRRLDARYGAAELRSQAVGVLRDGTRAALAEAPGRDAAAALAELAELAGWLSQDCALHGPAQRYYIQALGLAEHAGDAALAGWALSSMAGQAARLGHARESLALARAALDRAEKSSPAAVRAMLHDRRARALARAGREEECAAALRAVENAAARARPGDAPGWAAHYGDADVAACLGHCLLLLGRADAALGHLRHARDGLSPDRRARARVHAEVDLALAHLRGPDVDAALEAAGRALDLAGGVRSDGVAARLRDLDAALAAHGDRVAVRRWRDLAAGRLRPPAG